MQINIAATGVMGHGQVIIACAKVHLLRPDWSEPIAIMLLTYCMSSMHSLGRQAQLPLLSLVMVQVSASCKKDIFTMTDAARLTITLTVNVVTINVTMVTAGTVAVIQSSAFYSAGLYPVTRLALLLVCTASANYALQQNCYVLQQHSSAQAQLPAFASVS